MTNPISPPPAVASYALFDYRAVALTTFLGSPLAGSILLALNYRRLGKTGAASAAVGLGLVVTVLLLLVSYAVPSNAMTALPILLMLGMRYSAKALQGREIGEHVASGGPLASRWAAAGIGLAVLLVLFAIIFGYLLADTPSKKVTIGAKDEVYYTGAATEQDARALGQALVKLGYFKDRGVSAMVSKGKGGVTVSFVVKDGAWDEPARVSAYEQIARAIAPSVGGLPLRIHLVNNTFDMKKEITVE